MGRPLGGKNKKWTREEKLRIVRRYFDEGIGQNALCQAEGIARGLVTVWIAKYLADGEVGLENKKKTGNPFAAIHTSKTLSEIERLRLQVARQEIEIERLKKGYSVEGDGAKKEFVTLSRPSLR